MDTKNTKLDEYWTTLAEAIPDFPAEQQRVAITIYRELAKGKPVSAEQLAAALNVSSETAQAMISQEPISGFVHSDEQGRIDGFAGLAAAPMHHEFRVKDQQLWTWCAWDGLFIPKVLGETAELRSKDPETGEVVRVTVQPSGIAAIEPHGAVVSFLLPEADDFARSATNVMANFCHHVFFFASRESGERWASAHPGTLLYSAEEAFELGRKLIEKQFGQALSASVGA